MPVGLYMSKSTTRSIGTFSGRIGTGAEAVSSECMALSPRLKKLSIDTEGASRLRRDGLAQFLAEQVRPLIRRERPSLPEIGRRAQIGRASCRERVWQYV